jgi:hypothetical protein
MKRQSTRKHRMENFKLAEEILASPESLYSIQFTVHSSILTLLTVHNATNYKRSVRLKFSRIYSEKDEGLQIHLQTSFAATLSGGPNEMSYLSRKLS